MSNVTYGTLDKVLRSLGFTSRVLRDQPPARWYEHAKSGAVVSLPVLPPETLAYPHHLAAVQGTLNVYGIADPLDFTAEVQRAS
jgi:hypothetical protein